MLDGSPHRRSRAGLWFAAGTVVSLLLLLASRTAPALTLQEVTARALDPVRSAIGGVGAGISGVLHAPSARSTGCARRTTACAASWPVPQARLAELREAAAENAELRGLLGLTTSLQMDLLPVRILGARSEQLHLGGRHRRRDRRRGPGRDAGRRRRRWRGRAGRQRGRGRIATRRPFGWSSMRAPAWWPSTSRSRALGLVQGQLGGQLVMVQVQRHRPGRGRRHDRQRGPDPDRCRRRRDRPQPLPERAPDRHDPGARARLRCA